MALFAPLISFSVEGVEWEHLLALRTDLLARVSFQLAASFLPFVLPEDVG